MFVFMLILKCYFCIHSKFFVPTSPPLTFSPKTILHIVCVLIASVCPKLIERHLEHVLSKAICSRPKPLRSLAFDSSLITPDFKASALPKKLNSDDKGKNFNVQNISNLTGTTYRIFNNRKKPLPTNAIQ